MRRMDRYLFANFLSAFIICFTSMVGLYIIIDLFAQMDEFIEDHAGTLAFLRRAGTYYLLHSFEYFDRLSPIITQIAAMTTLASLHRHNEIVPLLAAGVPTRRILVPVLAGAAFVVGLGVLNREVVLSNNSEALQRRHEDVDGLLSLQPTMASDKDKVLFRAGRAFREDKRLEDVSVTLPMELVGQLQEIQCPRAYYEQHEATKRYGWRLVSPSPLRMLQPNDKLLRLENGDLFLFSNVDFAAMIRRPHWMSFASTNELVGLLQSQELKNPRQARVRFHERFLQPGISMMLVLIGIPFVLQWERKNIYQSIAVSMVLSGLFFVTGAAAGFFAVAGYIGPVTAAWVPILVFGPLTACLFDRIGT